MFQLWIQCNLFLLIPLLVAGLIMSFLCMHSEAKIRRIWGWGGIVTTGVIGTPIHECSHLLMALLFGYKIVDVKLLCPISGKTTGVLGYVKYRYKKTLLSKIGNFFVGIAPMIGGSLVIWLLFYLLFPDAASLIKENSISNLSDPSIFNIQILRDGLDIISGKIGQFIIFVVLLCAISLHMSISKADLKGAAYGVIFLEIILLCLSFATWMLQWNGVYPILDGIMNFLWMILVIGLAAATLTFILISLIPSK